MENLSRILYLLHFDPKQTTLQNEGKIYTEQNKSDGNLLSTTRTKSPIDNTYIANRGPKQLTKKIYDNFYLAPNLLNTKKPQPPKVREYFKQSGTKVTTEPMEYTRYEGQNQYKTYYFNSDENSRYYDIYKIDLERWNLQNSFWEKNKHDILDIAAIGSIFLPYGFLISILFEGLNIGMYVAEGDKYEAGLRTLFLMIPFGQLAKKFPPIREMGETAFKKFVWEKLSKRKGGNLSDNEIKVVESLSKGKKWIENQVTSTIVKKVIKLVFSKKTTLRGIVNFIWLLSKKYPKTKFILGLTISIGGVVYTWSELAKIFGISEKKDYKEKVVELESEWDRIKTDKISEVSDEITNELIKSFSDSGELTKIFLEVFNVESKK